jgi:hypothetical protein
MLSWLSFQPWLASPASVIRPYSRKPSPSRSPLLLHPADRRADARPELPDRGEIAGALEVGAGQHHEERRRVDAAVVASERHLAGLGHLAAADLVQDLARLGIALRVMVDRLVGGEEPQHAAGEVGIEPERLEGGDERVAPERVQNHGTPA